MARNLIFSMATLAAGMFAASTQRNFSGPHSLQWNGWAIKINAMDVTG
jgi:hypothetical protein